MKKIAIILCGLGLGLLNLSAQETKETVPPLSGWKYYGGDEFNGTAINRKLWGIYGDKTRDYFFDVYGNNKNQGMAQTYRDNMIKVQDGLAIVRATRSKIFTGLRSDYTEKMRFPPKPGHGYTDYGWWSGFLSSRDAQTGNKDEQNKEIGCYYPLYSRIEIKAKIPFRIGTWMALWLRHYTGASTFEIDLQEFFVNDDPKVDRYDKYEKHRYYNANKNFLHQSVHGIDYQSATDENPIPNKYNNNAYADRVKEIKFDPSEDFHVYGAQIDPLPTDSGRHLAVTFLLDGRVRSVFLTSTDIVSNPKSGHKYRYNALLRPEFMPHGIDHVWDVAITGGIGGTPGDHNSGILYPERDPQYHNDINKTPKDYIMDIDWLRVYKRENELLWVGAVPQGWDWETTTAKINLSKEVPVNRLAKLQVGDKLILDIDTLPAKDLTVPPSTDPKMGPICDRDAGPSSIDICNKSGKSIVTLKPEVARNDAQVTFYITDEDMLNALKADGCSIIGQNIRLFSLVREKKDDGIWSGFKQIDDNNKVVIPKTMFDGVTEKQVLEVTVRDVKRDAKIVLPQWNEADRTIPLVASNDEKQYYVALDKNTVKMLKDNGLYFTGAGFYLRSIKLKNKKDLPLGIKNITSHKKENESVYTMSGVKVKETNDNSKLAPGIYVTDGAKFVVK
ncbi:glycoside hydrolase family 16 protein [Prevotella histicola]|uniref:Glycoside hydrolase family 16 n=1 Tax=Prevotella histicola JCM 15637 = DNF00424 TaxID=1236504 RepID=A0AAW3FEK3_9BACT|nr:glycoside hydrolase family 16 [Prevotella histicola]KGF26624.1 glycoside hydrolase family 16 [Prevotella histicola JCM 15637 = DNF00424]